MHGVSSVKNYNYKVNLNWSSKYDHVTEQELFNDVTQRYEDLIQSATIRFFKADQNGRSSVTVHYNDSLNVVKHFDVAEQRHRKFGKCYSMRPTKKHRKLGMYRIKFLL